MAEIAKAAKVPLAAFAPDLDALGSLTENLTKAGLEDLVLDPGDANNTLFQESLQVNMVYLRKPLKKSQKI